MVLVLKMNLLLFTILFSLQLRLIICMSNCENFETCSDCIRSVDKCLWCPANDHKGKRCQSQEYHSQNQNWCKTRINLPEIIPEIIKNANFSGVGKTVQIRPQHVVIKSASVGIPVNIPISYKPAKDEPLDVYYLLDNTLDIEKYINSLKNEAKNIFEELKNYTNNVRLGFGTFVEKPALPYADPDIHYVYTFKNHLSLTNNSEEFKRTLNMIKRGSNYDVTEDVLDGLMQAMVCKKEVGWKDGGRRIIVVVTTAFYHSAGDGKMVGAFKPHDMKCHIDGSMDLVMDYPSTSQINKVAKDGGFSIVFAVTKNHEEAYRLLSKNIVGAKFILLNETNIATIIKKEYIKLIEKFHITHNATPSLIQVTTKKNCSDCIAMHFSPLHVDVTIKVVSCPNPPRSKEIIDIKATSLNGGLITVEVEYNCQCECEKDASTISNSSMCHNGGNYQCGICKCNPNRYGEFCQCEGNSLYTNDDSEKCKKDTTDMLACSGHGECRCGQCVSCHKGFSGRFCEFDDNSCSRRDGKLCSGHGKCTLGKCECDPKWGNLPGNDDCGCLMDQSQCIAPHSDKVCSGNGECKCGICSCYNMDNSNDTCRGRYCDKCKWFADKRCEELEDYAYCNFLNKTSCKDEYNKTDTTVLFANRSEINSPNNSEWYMATLCRVKRGEDFFIFKYYYASEVPDADGGSDTSTLTIVIQNELDELPPANIKVAIGSSIGGILLIGLLTLLLWKVLADMYDAREYNTFAEKARAAGYDVNMTENSLYEPPVQTFNNPVYQR